MSVRGRRRAENWGYGVGIAGIILLLALVFGVRLALAGGDVQCAFDQNPVTCSVLKENLR